MADHDLAWAAGLFEGEGCISVTRRGRVILALNMTDEDVVLSFARVVGVGSIRKPRLVRPGVKLLYRWDCQRRGEVCVVLDALLPLLHDRRHAKALVALRTIRGELFADALTERVKDTHDYERSQEYADRNDP